MLGWSIREHKKTSIRQRVWSYDGRSEIEMDIAKAGDAPE
jgi:hypothetical protein